MFAVVADTTSDLTLEQLDALGVHVVPLNVLFGDETYVDAYELGPAEFYEKMDAFLPDVPKSACPTSGAFAEAYRAAVAAGSDGIVCLTISAGVSGTHNASVVGAQSCEDMGVPIRCIDSKTTAGTLSLLIEKACALRDEGATADEAADILEACVEQAELFIAMETIEFVIKGGRLEEDKASELAVKGVLKLRKSDGGVELLARPRGLKAQRTEIVALVEDYLDEHPGAIVRFSQANSLERIDKLKEDLDAKGIAYSDRQPGWIAGLLGVYIGNHSYTVSVFPAELA